MTLPQKVKLVEVGPRDGLQDESIILSVEKRIDFINMLAQCGYKNIEMGSFVSKYAVPQMHQSDKVLNQLNRSSKVKYSALVPNTKGLEIALESQVDSIAIFMAGSETFSKNNINCSIEESLERYSEVINTAKQHNLPVRGYLSCIFSCPYEGNIPEEIIIKYAKILYSLGCYEIALGDTTGLGTPTKIQSLINNLTPHIPKEKIAFHLHNTNGLSLVNIYSALHHGISTFDCAIAGLGGCPFAKNSTGNVASEDLVYLLNSLGIETGIKLDQLVSTSKFICQLLGHQNNSSLAKIYRKITKGNYDTSTLATN
ncbi:MAG: hydroxymethylglutaryl-CoA lyase [Legionellales bacterium]|nr:hydroxymethylglutaryl-CoA lyase [Legionellales bacterium]